MSESERLPQNELSARLIESGPEQQRNLVQGFPSRRQNQVQTSTKKKKYTKIVVINKNVINLILVSLYAQFKGQ